MKSTFLLFDPPNHVENCWYLWHSTTTIAPRKLLRRLQTDGRSRNTVRSGTSPHVAEYVDDSAAGTGLHDGTGAAKECLGQIICYTSTSPGCRIHDGNDRCISTTTTAATLLSVGVERDTEQITIVPHVI